MAEDQSWLSDLASKVSTVGSYVGGVIANTFAPDFSKFDVNRGNTNLLSDVRSAVGAAGAAASWVSDKDPTKGLPTNRVAQWVREGIDPNAKGDEWDTGLIGQLGAGFGKLGRLGTYLGASKDLALSNPNFGTLNKVAWDRSFNKDSNLDVGAAWLAPRSFLEDPNGVTNLHKELDSTWWGNATAGAMTMGFYGVVDPTRGLGRVAKAARAASYVTDAAHADRLAGIINTADGSLPAPGNLANTARVTVGRGLNEEHQAGNFLKSMDAYRGITDPLKLIDMVTPMFAEGTNGARAAMPGIVEMMADAAKATADPVLQAQTHANILLSLAQGADSMKWLADNAPMIAAKGRRLSSAPDEFSMMRSAMDDIEANGVESLDIGKLVESHYSANANKAELTAYASEVEKVRAFREAIQHGGEGATPVEFGTSGKGTMVKPRTLELLKTGLNQYLANGYLLQGGQLGRTINILDRTVNSVVTARAVRSVSLDDPVAGSKQLMDTMRRFNDKLKTADGPDVITPYEIQQTAESYLGATQLGRTAVIENLNGRLQELVAHKYSPLNLEHTGYKLDPADVRKMVAMDTSTIRNGRVYAVSKAQAAKAAKEKDTYLGDFGGSDLAVDTAQLESQMAGNHFLWDWETANRAVDTHYRNARLENGDRMLAKSGIGMAEKVGHSNAMGQLVRAQMIWKHGVLMRLGLAPRALMDTGGRATIINGVMVTAYGAKAGAENFVRNHGRGLLDNSVRREQSFDDIAGAQRMGANIEALKAEGAAQGVKILDRGLQNVKTSELAESLAYKVQHGPNSKPGQYHSQSRYYDGMAQRAVDLGLRQRSAARTFGGENALGLKALTDEFNVAAVDRKAAIAGAETAKATYEAGSGVLTKRTLLSTPQTHAGRVWQATRNDLEDAHAQQSMTAGGSVSDMYGMDVSRQMQGYRANLESGSQNIAANDPQWDKKIAIVANELNASPTARAMLIEHGTIATPVRTPEVVVRSFMDNPTFRKEYLKVSGETRVDPAGMRDWLTTVQNRLESVAPTQQVRDMMTSGKMITAEMAGTIKGADRFPIYGPEILRTEQSAGEKFIESFYRHMLDMPDMNLARVPMYSGLYHANIEELLPSALAKAKAAGRDGLTDREAQLVHQSAKGRAANDVRRDMYDANRQVGAHAVTQIVSPFFRPWEDAMMSWGRLLYDDPSRIGQLMRVSQTPDMFGITTKQDGTKVKPFDGTPLQDKYVTIPMFGLGGLEGFRANLGSFNSIQQGNVPFSPGVGPLVQLSASALVADVLPNLWGPLGGPGREAWKYLAEHPDNLFIKSVFPQSGLPKSDPTTLALSVLPSWARKAIDALGGSDDASFGSSYASAFATRYNSLIIKYRTENGGRDPSVAERKVLQGYASTGARATGIASAASAFLMGVSGNAAPEGQFYMDKIHALNAIAPALAAQGLTPSGVFAAAYPQASNLNWSLSVNEGRLEAVVNATSAYQKYRNLMDDNKESSWWIAGADNMLGVLGNPDAPGNTFSQSAYNQQMNEGLRRRYTKGELAAQTDIAMGYGRMGEFVAARNLYMRQNDIKSLNSKNAGQLSVMTAEYKDQLRAQFPAWALDVDTTDKGKKDRQFTQIQAIVTDPPPGLRDRPDVVTTAKYMFARQKLQDFAASQGVASWQTSKQYVDDRYALWQYGQSLAAKDIVFQQGWTRLFETEFNKDLGR